MYWTTSIYSFCRHQEGCRYFQAEGGNAFRGDLGQYRCSEEVTQHKEGCPNSIATSVS